MTFEDRLTSVQAALPDERDRLLVGDIRPLGGHVRPQILRDPSRPLIEPVERRQVQCDDRLFAKVVPPRLPADRGQTHVNEAALRHESAAPLEHPEKRLKGIGQLRQGYARRRRQCRPMECTYAHPFYVGRHWRQCAFKCQYDRRVGSDGRIRTAREIREWPPFAAEFPHPPGCSPHVLSHQLHPGQPVVEAAVAPVDRQQAFRQPDGSVCRRHENPIIANSTKRSRLDSASAVRTGKAGQPPSTDSPRTDGRADAPELVGVGNPARMPRERSPNATVSPDVRPRRAPLEGRRAGLSGRAPKGPRRRGTHARVRQAARSPEVP
ncbi:MAG: hypothetical protein QOE61_3252 [Micromonosporaceae bacterium]|nr:hypothetical protein [Micromonosporaceae bacterium]